SSHSFSFVPREHPIPPLFPYTTLFRSGLDRGLVRIGGGEAVGVQSVAAQEDHLGMETAERIDGGGTDGGTGGGAHPARQHVDVRSEEHTSELQSRFDLVCRLLLEKKKA